MKIAEVLEHIHRGNLVEIRALGVGNSGKEVWSGYFTDYEMAYQAALQMEAAGASGVYMTLGRLHPGLLARAPNTIVKKPEHTTTNTDVLSNHWLLVDCDPIRPAGISSSDAELARAKLVRDDVAKWILGANQPGTFHLKACSGNGYHFLIYSPELFLNEETKASWLERCQTFFGDEYVKIDQSVTKPAQLCKLYGTMSRKGFSIEERPHRQSYVEGC